MNQPTRYNRALTLREPFFGSLLDRFFDEETNRPLQLSPRVDILESETAYQLVADFPGYEKNDVNVEVKNGVLTIKAEKNTESSETTEENGVKVLRSERVAGHYQRSFSVDESIDVENIKASLDNGVLKVDLPKVQPKKPESYNVEVH